MSITRIETVTKLKAFGGVCIVCATTGLLAACGGTASTQPANSKTARATPAQSGADVGTPAVKTTTGRRTGSSPAAARAVGAPRRHVAARHHSSTVNATGAKATYGRAGKIV